MNILEYIPVGHKNPVTRESLCMSTGLSDRNIRKLISEARRTAPIVNVQNGNGYYIPDMQDPVDKSQLSHFVKQEERRLKSIGWSLKAARRAAND